MSNPNAPERKSVRGLIIAVTATVLVAVITLFVSHPFSPRPNAAAKVPAASTANADTVNVPMKIGDSFKIVRTSGAATATSSVYITQNGLVQQGDPVIAIQGDPTTDALARAASFAAQYYNMPGDSLSQHTVEANNAALAAAKLSDKNYAMTCIGALGSLMQDAGVVTRNSSILATTFTNGNVEKACHYDTSYDAEHSTLNTPFDPTIGK